MENKEDVAGMVQNCRVESAVDRYVNKMSKEDLIKYVRWNMKDYYQNVADEDEGVDFYITGRDTSVYIE